MQALQLGRRSSGMLGGRRVRLVGQKMRIGKAVRASIPCVAGGAWEGDRVADIGETGDVGERALEAEAKAGVRHRAVAAEIAVPGVLVPVDAALTHRLVQYLKPFLALAAANDLADPRRQYVHCRDRAAVVVDPYVKGFDGLWVIHHDDRLLRVLLGQI